MGAVDFELEISSGRPFEYFGKVLNSPGGQSVRCPLKFKFAKDPKDLDILRLTLENAVLRGGDQAAHRGPTSQCERVLRDFGRELFRSIFVEPGPIRDAYAQSKGVVSGDGQNDLRIKLRIEPPELSSLPWEYLYDENETPNYIGLRLPVVRHLDVGGAAGQMRVNGPLRILGMIANPGTEEWPKLDETAEKRRIAQAIDKLEQEGRVIFEWVPGGTGRDLLSKLVENDWHIFHFIGHGGVEEESDDSSNEDRKEDTGFIVLVDEYGNPVKKFASDLAVLVNSPNRSLRLAVLNCCESAKMNTRDKFGSPAVTLIRSGLPAVVAMQFPIRDKAAIRLAEGFYRSLANRFPVDTAVTIARRFIKDDSDIEWAIPVLYMRASDGRIFEVTNPSAAASSPTPVHDGVAPASDIPTKKVEPQSDEKLKEFMQLLGADQKTADHLENVVRLGRNLLEERKADQPVAALVARVYCDLGRMQLEQNEVPKAAASLSSAIELDPSEPEYRIRRSNLYARVGFTELALSDIAEAIKLRPDTAEYHWVRGIVYSMLASSGENPSVLKDAINAFGAAIKLNGAEPKYLMSRANALVQLEQYTEALADIDQAIRLAPGNADLMALRVKIAAAMTGNARDNQGSG
jgi:tetratricopeptide (TPR) repeat protein